MGFPVSCFLGERELDDFGIYTVPPDEKEKALEQVLRRLEPGVNLLIGHPGLNSMENDALVHFEPEHVQLLGTGRCAPRKPWLTPARASGAWSTSPKRSIHKCHRP